MFKKNRIVIVEPSIFRAADTYILGPYNKFAAWFVAHREIIRNPHAAARVVNSKSRVMLGKEILWQGKEEIEPLYPKGIYR